METYRKKQTERGSEEDDRSETPERKMTESGTRC